MIGTVPTSSGKMERRKEDRGKKVNKAAILNGCVQVRERECMCCVHVCVCCLFVTDVSHLSTC